MLTQAPGEKGSEVDGQKARGSDVSHDRIRKKIEGQHIEEQMRLVHVQETRREQTDSFSSDNGANLKLVLLKENPVLESLEGHSDIGYDYQ